MRSRWLAKALETILGRRVSASGSAAKERVKRT